MNGTADGAANELDRPHRPGALPAGAFSRPRLKRPSPAAPDRHRLLFEHNIAGTFRATLDGRLVDCNRAFARLLGYDSPAEVLASPQAVGPLPSDRGRFLARLLRQGSLNELKVAWRRKDGSRILLVENVVLVGADGAPGEIEGTVTESLAPRARARDGGLLARGVIHDVNNLLTAVVGDCELLAHQCHGDAEMEKLLEGARAAGAWAATLASRLLDGATPDESSRILDLNQLVAVLEPTLRKMVGERVALTTSLDPEPVWVRADAAPLGGAILNLVLNARDAMPDGGRLTIQISRVPAEIAGTAASQAPSAPGPYAVLTVQDSGEGMDSRTQARIFEPGFTTRRRGKGLGLAMVREAVERGGGRIEVESCPGAGSTFRLWFPAVPAGPAGSRRHGKIPRARHPATVLVVEDEEMVRDVVRKALEAAGHRVLAARDAAEASALARERGALIDLLLTDVTLPQVSGRELAASLRAFQPALKVLFMSGDTHRMPSPAGAADSDFIAKPFKPRTLVDKVERLLGTGL